jgi:hypothetical protein
MLVDFYSQNFHGHSFLCLFEILDFFFLSINLCMYVCMYVCVCGYACALFLVHFLHCNRSHKGCAFAPCKACPLISIYILLCCLALHTYTYMHTHHPQFFDPRVAAICVRISVMLFAYMYTSCPYTLLSLTSIRSAFLYTLTISTRTLLHNTEQIERHLLISIEAFVKWQQSSRGYLCRPIVAHSHALWCKLAQTTWPDLQHHSWYAHA